MSLPLPDLRTTILIVMAVSLHLGVSSVPHEIVAIEIVVVSPANSLVGSMFTLLYLLVSGFPELYQS